MKRRDFAFGLVGIVILLGACSSSSKSAVTSALTSSTTGESASTTSAAAASTTSTVAASALGSPTTATPGPGALVVTEHDFALATSATTVSSGNVALNITNQGPSSHELLAFRTDLPQDQLPLGADGRINEDALTKVVDTGTDLNAGTQRSLSAALTPGRYVLVCNLPGHYKLGMHSVLTVT
jgi:uncharacterized cupredoxin-like copper-binding protein